MLQKGSTFRGGFTLVEIMIVVAIIAILASIALPSARRARLRTQATAFREVCRQLDGACDQWAVENGKPPGTAPTPADLAGYIKGNSDLNKVLAGGSIPTDPLGRPVTMPKVDTSPKVDPATVTDLTDIVDSHFWEMYQ